MAPSNAEGLGGHVSSEEIAAAAVECIDILLGEEALLLLPGELSPKVLEVDAHVLKQHLGDTIAWEGLELPMGALMLGSHDPSLARALEVNLTASLLHGKHEFILGAVICLPTTHTVAASLPKESTSPHPLTKQRSVDNGIC